MLAGFCLFMRARKLNLLREKFSRLTVIENVGSDKNYNSLWLCECQCGNKIIVVGKQLKHGVTKSCGCLKIDLLKERSISHHKTETAEYRIWRHIKSRCLNPNVWNYHNYGGRGITICERWKNSFENFYEDMGPRPSKSHSLDRYPDKNGDYEPGNCRWATLIEQANNCRSNHIIKYKNNEGTIAQIARKLNLKASLISSRLKKGWSIEDAIEKPIDVNKISYKYRK